MDTKIIGIIGVITLALLIGGVFLMSKQSTPNIPKDQIVSENGLHWHPTLQIFIKGEKQEIPANIGLGAIHLPIHTHEEDAKEGVLHLEMQGLVKKDDIKLGNFFKNWEKKFDSQCIFDNCNEENAKVKMTVNGKENKDLENYLMQDKDKIEIRYE